jgi:hypothetical protein
MGENEEKLVSVANSVVSLAADELAARFEAVMNPRGAWKGEQLEPLKFMCRMLANISIDYFAEQAQAGEKLQ